MLNESTARVSDGSTAPAREYADELVVIGSRWKSKTSRPDAPPIVLSATTAASVVYTDPVVGPRTMLRKSLRINYVYVDTGTTGHATAAKRAKPKRAQQSAQSTLGLFAVPTKDCAETIEKREILITPKMATEMLKGEGRQRAHSKSRVEMYARAMRNKKWTKSAPIDIGPNGELGNGGHRLRAIEISGESVMMVVFYWKNKTEFDAAVLNMDRGRARTSANVLEIAGAVKKGQGESAAATIAAMVEFDKRLPLNPDGNMILKYFEARKTSIEATLALPKHEFKAVTRAALAIAHMEYPAQIGDLIKAASLKTNLKQDSAAHAFVMWLPKGQHALRYNERKETFVRVLGHAHRHVLGRESATQRNSKSPASIPFFMGANFRNEQGE